MNIEESREGIAVAFNYWTSKFSRAEAINIAQTFNTAVTRVLQNTSGTIGDVHLLSKEAENQIMEWNATCPSAVTSSFHEMFNNIVLQQPASPAIQSWDGSYTYAELDEASSRLAKYITGLGCGPGKMVPMCFDKSAWTVVSMLAVLKAGAACVQLDPRYPALRTKAIIEATRATIVLTTSRVAGLFEGLRVRAMDVEETLPTLEPVGDFVFPTISPDSVAFVVFTSGSTGLPKGIEVLHQSMCTFATSIGPPTRFSPQTRLLQFAAHTFDASNGDVFITLIYGGCLCIPSDHDRTNDLTGAINRMKVNTIFLTPTVADLLIPTAVPTLKNLCIGGEAIGWSLFNRWSNVEGLHLINVYGPAECTVWCAMNRLMPGDHPTNFGRGLSSVLWICDERDRLTPLGCVGELLVEGPLLARGYFNDKEKTDAAFIKEPQFLKNRANRSTRVYKTGDLVRYNMDGTMDYVGRKDTQVKLRGQRIELGEIEYHLGVQDGVRLSVVKIPSKGPFNGRLTAAVNLDNFTPSSFEDAGIHLVDRSRLAHALSQTSKIQEQLLEHLPGYMIPSDWVPVQHFPVTSSGKVDRVELTKWLEEIDQDTYDTLTQVELLSEIERPLNSVELQLQAVWSKVLDVPVSQITASKSFLRAGGDSVSAMKVVTQSRAAGISITVQDILRSKSLEGVAQLARHSDASQAQREETPLMSRSHEDWDEFVNTWLPKLQFTSTDEIEDIYPCSHMQQGILLSQIKSPETYIIRIRCEIVSPDGSTPIDPRKLHGAWSEVVRYHPILRTIFVETRSGTGLFNQVVLRNCEPEVVFADIATAVRKSFEIVGANRPPHRLTISQDEAGKVHIMLELSHAIIDGTSIQIMARDLARAYAEELPTGSGPLFSNYIATVQEHLSEHALDYWVKYLDGTEPCHLPALGDLAETDQNCSIEIGTLEASPIQSFCKEHDISLANFFQAIWALVLSTYCGSEDVSFGYVTSGRDTPVVGIEDAVGVFVNMLVCRVDMRETTSVLEVMRKVKEDFLEGLEYQHCSLAEILHALGLSKEQLFNTCLDFQVNPSNKDDGLGNRAPTILTESSEGQDYTEVS